ncbi:MAG: hypothetical protein NTX82_02715 [Candidatus Parcubacteria bacterium]|nr:hypothetical protein [Candidatus Parcubacteria bacterium]
MKDNGTLKIFDWTDLLTKYGRLKYTPHIFLAKPSLPKEIKLELKIKEEYDLTPLFLVILSMIIEKARIMMEKASSIILKPANYPNTHLLAKLKEKMPHYPHIRGISINSEAIFFSFNNIFNQDELANKINNNMGGYIFTKKTDKSSPKTDGGDFYYNDIKVFSVNRHVVIFPYEMLSQQNTVEFSFCLELIAELITMIHSQKPFYMGPEIYYHEYVPILKLLLRELYTTEVLGKIISQIVTESDYGQKPQLKYLTPAKKEPSKYRYIGELPSHIKYLLLIPAKDEVAIGLDCVLNLKIISQRVSGQTLLENTDCFHEQLTLSEKSILANRNKMEFKENKWQRHQHEYNLKGSVISDSSGQELLLLTSRTLTFKLSTFKNKPAIIIGIINAIYDNMFYYTNSVHTEKLNCALTPVERELIVAIDSLVFFYRLFAYVKVEQEAYKTGHYLSEKEWVLTQLQAAGTEDLYKKILFVLRKIILIGKDDIPMLIEKNDQTKQSYESLIALLRKIERLSTEQASG